MASTTFRRVCLLLGALLLCVSSADAAKKKGKKESVPDWIAELQSRGFEYDRFEDDTNALILLNDKREEYDSSGAVVSTVRRAVHVKSRDEREQCIASIYLNGSSSKILKFSAWMFYPDGKVEAFGKRDLVKVGGNLDQLYSETSFMILNRAASAKPDTIFAYDYEVSRTSTILESFHIFQESVPVLESRLEVEIPEGWRLNAVPFNCDGVERVDLGSESTWLLKNLPAIKDEPGRPPLFAVAGMLGISVYPSDRDANRYKLETFDSWAALARYLIDSQIDGLAPTPEIEAKSRELTEGKEGDWEKIKAICEFAQSVNYVAVSMNLAKGGGYIPRPASFVLEKHYGDCKDMTVLARSLLASAGYESYAVVASIGEEEFVHSNWPSPVQFNHCVLAVELPDSVEVEAPAIVDHPQRGRLLLFDPTAKYTLVGHLPSALQNGSVLVGGDWSSELLRLPINEPTENLTSREVVATVAPDGTVSGKIIEISNGNGADYMRSLSRRSSPEELDELLQAWIARGTREATVSNVTVSDDPVSNKVVLELEFEAPRYARILGDSKMIVRPVFLARREWVPPTEEERTTAFEFHPWKLEETIHLEFPTGYEVDSMRPPHAQETGFYSYSLSGEGDANRVSITRKRESRTMRVPKKDYPAVVDFFEKMTRTESAPVVMGRGES